MNLCRIVVLAVAFIVKQLQASYLRLPIDLFILWFLVPGHFEEPAKSCLLSRTSSNASELVARACGRHAVAEGTSAITF